MSLECLADHLGGHLHLEVLVVVDLLLGELELSLILLLDCVLLELRLTLREGSLVAELGNLQILRAAKLCEFALLLGDVLLHLLSRCHHRLVLLRLLELDCVLETYDLKILI